MNKFILIIICTLIFILQIQTIAAKKLLPDKNSFAVIKNQKVFLSVADTEEELIQGLMYVDGLKENEGMLFLFGMPDYRAFWMKNMKIPLDILFLYENKLVTIYKNIPACKKMPCPIYKSTQKSDTVLELKAGFCEKYNVKIGDPIKFTLFNTY